MSRRSFISYILAKESMPFTKYPVLHQLEQWHGVDLGETYKTRESACSFVANTVVES